MTLSKPFKTPRPQKPAKRSTTSWTIPKPGDVINYAYLWEYEARKGKQEGLKDRPVVVVLTVTGAPDNPVISVCPITSRTPPEGADFLEMPPRIKNHLGLTDRDKSYVITTEINRFIWPGPDIRPFEHKERTSICYGQLPEKLLYAIRDRLIVNIKAHRLKTTSRE